MVGTDAKVDLGPLVHQIGAGLRSAHLGDELEHAVEWATPKIAEGAAHAAPHALSAFVNVWLHSDLWGRMLIGGYALKRLGLLGAVAGRTFGTSFAASAAESEAAGGALSGGAAAGATARGGRFGRLLNGARGAGALLGPEAAAAAIFGPDIWKFGHDTLGPAIFGGPTGRTRAQSDARLKSMGHVKLRLPDGSTEWASQSAAAIEINLHHATVLDGKVIARSVTKHANDARARKGS
jgi:hypothetical protein